MHWVKRHVTRLGRRNARSFKLGEPNNASSPALSFDASACRSRVDWVDLSERRVVRAWLGWILWRPNDRSSGGFFFLTAVASFLLRVSSSSMSRISLSQLSLLHSTTSLVSLSSMTAGGLTGGDSLFLSPLLFVYFVAFLSFSARLKFGFLDV